MKNELNELELRRKNLRNISTLKELLDSSAELFPQRPAFLVKKEKGCPYQEITYAQVKNDVDALGTQLVSMGLSGEKIAVIGENCYEWIVSYFAIANGVGVVVPLDKELTQEEICNLLSIAQCRAVIFTGSYRQYFENYDIPFKIEMKLYGDRTDLRDTLPVCKEAVPGKILVWEELVGAGQQKLDQGDRSYADGAVPPDDMRILLFTSGTMEAAKGVMLSHRNIASNVIDTCKIAHIEETDRTLSILPIHHTFECTMGMILVLYRGASTAFFEGLKYVTKNLEEAQATVLIGVPLIFENIYDKIWKQAEKQGKEKILKKGIRINRALQAMNIDMSRRIFKSVLDKFGGKLRLIITGAAGIDPNVCRGFEDFGLRVLQGYGLTECAPLVSGTPDYCNTYKKAGSVGTCVDSGRIRIENADEDGIGEILFQGPNVMLGYYNMPEKTAEVLKDGWFHTGDLGFLDQDGWLYIAGRQKNVIVTKTGKNIYPEEVETYLNRSHFIAESMVYGTETEEDTLVSAQIRPDYELISQELGAECSDKEIEALMKRCVNEVNEALPIYKRVRVVLVRREEFVKTTTKKIKRFQNLQRSESPSK